MLEFDSFYNGFMAPYFGCYRCVDTKAAFLALDIDKDGLADWEEFKLFLIYALEEHPDRIAELEDLLNIAFIKGILPLMKGLPVINWRGRVSDDEKQFMIMHFNEPARE